MTEAERYDAVVIGSGEGGKYLAWDMAQAGQKVAVMERRWIGGSCPNINCLPSKNEIWSAGVAHTVAHAGEYGVVAGPVSVDMKTVVARKPAACGGDLPAGDEGGFGQFPPERGAGHHEAAEGQGHRGGGL